MSYLTLENITKHYGEKILFQNLSFTIDKGNKVALVARNGSGKSTLIKILTGEERSEGETAKVLLLRDVRIGILPQEPVFHEQESIMEAIFDSENPILKAIKQYETASLLNQPAQLQAAINKMDDLEAWDYEHRIKEILQQFNIEHLEQSMGQLSGGQRKRVALARILIEEPEFLILDEPTNHLDLDMIEWLENYLMQPHLTIFMITHDRYFLDRVCNVILELEQGQIHKYRGNYAHFLEKKMLREEVDSTTLDKQKKYLKREIEWVRRMPQARGTKAKARVDAFYDLKEKTSRTVQNTKVELDFEAARLGKKIVECYSICKSYGEQKIVEDFSYKFKKGERVGIVGPNGTGKTTFIQLLTGEVAPDKGRVQVGETVVFGHYSQKGIELKKDQRIIEVVQDIAEFVELSDGRKATATQLLDRFLFSRPQQQVYVSQLSGGERRRLNLLLTLLQNPNFLILDEPTNDLDILTLNILEEFLEEYQGCLLIVTHDRYFMDKLVDHLFIFEGDGKIKDFNGIYSEYRAVKDLELEEANNTSTKSEAKPNEKQKLNYEQQKELSKLEREVEKLAQQKNAILAKFNDNDLNAKQIADFSSQLNDVQQKLDEKEMRWLELSELSE